MTDDPAGSATYWNKVLAESMRSFALAPNRTAYRKALLELVVKINDGHAQLDYQTMSSVRPPLGPCQVPASIRFVQGQPLVFEESAGLLPGDVIQQLDGAPVANLLDQWRPHYSASNEASRLFQIGQHMTRGPCGPAQMVVNRGGQSITIPAIRVRGQATMPRFAYDRPGSAFQRIDKDIAYLKLSSAKAADAANYVNAAAGTKGLIIDTRNYPADNVMQTLGPLLVSAPTAYQRPTLCDVANPGAFHWGEPSVLLPQQPHYVGRVVVLVGEMSISSAEYQAMVFRAAPGAVVIGSSTAGADGNVSTLPLPGAIGTGFSRVGVFYPDKRPTQRVGIVPDIVVKPAVEGVRAGHDEVLEAAIRHIKDIK